MGHGALNVRVEHCRPCSSGNVHPYPVICLHETVTRARWAGILMSRSGRASSLESGCHKHGSMKVIFLAGGLVAHLAEGTNYRAKPMVDIGGSPYIPVLRKKCSITCR